MLSKDKESKENMRNGLAKSKIKKFYFNSYLCKQRMDSHKKEQMELNQMD